MNGLKNVRPAVSASTEKALAHFLGNVEAVRDDRSE